MPVTVTLPPTGSNTEPKATHADGKTVIVKEGHLHVQSTFDADWFSSVAVYAPGKWVSVVVDKASDTP